MSDNESYKTLRVGIVLVLIGVLSNERLIAGILGVDFLTDVISLKILSWIINITAITIGALFIIGNYKVGLQSFVIRLSAVIVVSVFLLFILEAVSFTTLYTGIIPLNDIEKENLLGRFPAQLRCNPQQLFEALPEIDVDLTKKIEFYTFSFDPVLGFRGLSYVQYYDNDFSSNPTPHSFFTEVDGNNKGLAEFKRMYDKLSDDRLLIIAFGGSTTAHTSNWPGHFKKYAEKAGITRPIMIINTGTNGFSSFSEKVLFSDWVLPVLEDNGIRPDIILSLDGVNDILFNISGYIESVKHQSPIWYSGYHGYHQRLDNDIRSLQSEEQQGISLKSNRFLKTFVLVFRRLMPYTLKVVFAARKKGAGMSPTNEGLAIKFDPGISQNVYQVPYAVEDKIIAGFKSNLLDFFGASHIRGYQYVSYLQPIAHEKYYPMKLREGQRFPGVDYTLLFQHINAGDRAGRGMAGLAMGGDYVVPWSSIYPKAEKIYQELGERHPGHFVSLASLFRNTQTDLYIHDGVHYQNEASRLIAQAIVNDLIAKNILTKTE